MDFTKKMIMMAAYASAISLNYMDYDYGYGDSGTTLVGSTLTSTGDVVCDARLDQIGQFMELSKVQRD